MVDINSINNNLKHQMFKVAKDIGFRSKKFLIIIINFKPFAYHQPLFSVLEMWLLIFTTVNFWDYKTT